MNYFVLFAHGSSPATPDWAKFGHLREVCQRLGVPSGSLDYTDLDRPDDRVKRLLEQRPVPGTKLILVGASLGGYVSVVAAMKRLDVEALFLMAPALYIAPEECSVQEYTPKVNYLTVVHGWDDDCIPFENSVRFCRQTGAELHLVSDGHRLEGDREMIDTLFERFLKQVLPFESDVDKFAAYLKRNPPEKTP